MSYRIGKNERLAEAFSRVAAEEMDLALSQIERKDQGEAVQDARKAIKRLRALLRSLRVAFPEKMFRAENRRLAEVGHKISPLRDVHVQLDTLEKLRKKSGSAGDPVKGRLVRRQTSCIRQMPALRKVVRGMLQASRGAIDTLPMRNATAADLATGLKRIYKQGRNAFRTARRHPSAKNWHESRKKAKSLGYGFELIQSACPKRVSKWIGQTKKLTDALGEDHDLFMVLLALRHAHRAMPDRDFRLLAKQIARKRAKRQKEALKLAKRLYHEKPRCFGQRLDHYLSRVGTSRPSWK